jgi:chromosome segregation ATPase
MVGLEDVVSRVRSVLSDIDLIIEGYGNKCKEAALAQEQKFAESQLQIADFKRESLERAKELDEAVAAMEDKKYFLTHKLRNLESENDDLVRIKSERSVLLERMRKESSEIKAWNRNPVYHFSKKRKISPKVFRRICSFLECEDLSRLECVSRSFRSSLIESRVWKDRLSWEDFNVEVDVEEMHQHFIFEMKIDDRNLPLSIISVEEVMVPLLINCSDYVSRKRNVVSPSVLRSPESERSLSVERGPRPSGFAEFFGRMSSVSPSKPRGLQNISLEICCEDPRGYDTEMLFSLSALEMHRTNVDFERGIDRISRKMEILKSSKVNISMESAGIEFALDESRKNLDNLEMQRSSDTHTISLLTQQRDGIKKSLEEIQRTLETLNSEKKAYMESKEKIANKLLEKRNSVLTSHKDSSELMEKQIAVLATEVKSLRNELEVLQKEEVSLKETLAALKQRASEKRK